MCHFICCISFFFGTFLYVLLSHCAFAAGMCVDVKYDARDNMVAVTESDGHYILPTSLRFTRGKASANLWDFLASGILQPFTFGFLYFLISFFSIQSKYFFSINTFPYLSYLYTAWLLVTNNNSTIPQIFTHLFPPICSCPCCLRFHGVNTFNSDSVLFMWSLDISFCIISFLVK